MINYMIMIPIKILEKSLAKPEIKNIISIFF